MTCVAIDRVDVHAIEQKFDAAPDILRQAARERAARRAVEVADLRPQDRRVELVPQRASQSSTNDLEAERPQGLRRRRAHREDEVELEHLPEAAPIPRVDSVDDLALI